MLARIYTIEEIRNNKERIRGLFQLSGFHLDLEEKLKTNEDITS